MVPVENRPENRFEVLVDFSKFNDLMLRKLPEFAGVESSIVISGLVNAKAAIRTCNSLNIYDDKLLDLRIDNQQKAIFELNRIKAVIEMKILLQKENRFENAVFMIDGLITKIVKNGVSDKVRNAKGKKQVKKEYEDAKHVQFYKEKEFDRHEVSEHDLKSNDPFGIKDLIFDKK